MKAIINMLKDLIEPILLAFDFLKNMIKSLIDMAQIIPKIQSICMSAIAYLPSWLTAFAIITISVSTLYLIVGRSTGK